MTTSKTSSFMRARSQTEFDTCRRLVTLATCLPSQDELVLDHQRTSHVSWIKRYYFFILACLFFFFSRTLSLLFFFFVSSIPLSP